MALAAMAAVSQPLWAQEGYSGYFLDNYTYRFELNPAAGNNMAYVSLPGAGNAGASVGSNLDMRDFIYIKGGKPVYFTNPQVTTAEFMSNLPERLNLNAGTNVKLLSAGFNVLGGYANISVGTHQRFGATLPQEVLYFEKNGLSNEDLSIRDIRLRTDAYLTAGVNYSREITDGFRIGATLKYIAGMASVDMRVNKIDISLGEKVWQISSNADCYMSGHGLTYSTETYTAADGSSNRYVSGVDYDRKVPTPGGSGFAADFGAEWKWQGLTVSASLLDLGYISWGRTMLASTNGTRVFSTDKYSFSASDDNKKELDRMKDDLARLSQLEDNGEVPGLRQENLPFTVNAGVDYAMPFWEKLHVSAIAMYQFGNVFNVNEYRVGVNLAPQDKFSFAANYSTGSYGDGLGWMFNFTTRGFNIFMGMDRLPLRYARGKAPVSFFPMSLSASVNAGINIPF